MEQAPQRSALSGPTLIRLLARLAEIDVPEPRQSLSDRLSQWLGWTDAITLSSALNVKPPATADHARPAAAGRDAERLCARTRASLAEAIVGPADAKRNRAQPHRAVARDAAAAAPATADYAEFRQHYLSMQQAMQMDIGTLRARLRSMLATATPRLARLAALDAAMEQALGAREQKLLACVPALLGTYFTRLRNAEQQALAADAPASQSGPPVAAGAWLDTFRHDMQRVLLAELDIRFQPVEGLLAALRTR
ncbi:DUF3348 domain-containing protein [Burkholderia sp. TSV86]|uniref:DUF3348 domain-containing protein n=1 Tax=Burkholderia sp. TSV86 TaxID=1385594 RepID=UPI00075B4AAA|nr:DUF3348 domain-containing protein [Burkholderia sp. TSV86]KVE32541.1 hypothetical protein WS68_15470 [Burkholderia sp. TSV86]